jgi:hypothetical protein
VSLIFDGSGQLKKIGAKPPFTMALADVKRPRIAPFVAHGPRFF